MGLHFVLKSLYLKRKGYHLKEDENFYISYEQNNLCPKVHS